MVEECIILGKHRYTKKDWLIGQESIGKEFVDFKNAYHFAMSPTASYIKWAGILMESIMRKNPQLRKSICFHLLTDEVSNEDKKKLLLFSKKWEVSILLYFMNDANVNKFSRFTRYKINGKYINSIFYRWLIPYLVDREVKKVLCVDVDSVCNRDIESLLKENFKESLLVIHDIGEENHAKRLNLSSQTYFCAGFMHMNVDKMLEERVSERIIQYLYNCVENNIDLPLVEQDAANIILNGNVKFVNRLYHYPAVLGSRTIMKKEVQEDIHNAYFVHFIGKDKPWSVQAQGFSSVKSWTNDKEQSYWKNAQIAGKWNRRGHRVAARAAWINGDYSTWIRHKVIATLYQIKKSLTR